MKSTKNRLWDLKHSAKIVSHNFNTFYLNFKFFHFYWWWGPPGEMRSTKNRFCDLKYSAKCNSHNFETLNFSIFWKFCLPGHATGWGDICVTLCSQREGHKKFFWNVANFWRFAPLLRKRKKKLATFRKTFRVPPVANKGLQNDPPPVACPGRHYTTWIC